MDDGTNAQLKKDFLGNLEKGYSITGAAHKTKVARRTVYNWRDEDEDFAKAWEDAWEARGDWYEDQNRKAAVKLMMPAILNGLRIHGRIVERKELKHSGDLGLTWVEMVKEADGDGD